MKKTLSHIPLFLFLFTSLFSIRNTTVAQSNTISIAVNDIDYESPHLTMLKETFKKNSKVKSVKSTYTDGVANISFLYTGSSDELWDEVPATVKKNFKLSSINETSIVLDNAVAKKQAAPSNQANKQKINNTGNTGIKSQVNNNDCKACAYFPFCEYDYTRSFQGKEYKGIDYDGRIVYYRYENGELLCKTEMFDEWGISTGFSTEVILKCNAAKGTKWYSTMTGGFMSSGEKEYQVLEKGIPLTIDGQRYTDVLKISETFTMSNMMGSGAVSTKTVSYYAKGVGLVKRETPNMGDIFSQVFPNLEKNIVPGKNDLKGIIDPSLAGTWKYSKSGSKNSSLYSEDDRYIKFNTDGTFELYTGSLQTTNRMIPEAKEKIQKCYWKLNGTVLEILIPYGSIEKLKCVKKNDPKTGKPALEIQVPDLDPEGLLYLSQDNKKAW